MIFALKEPGLFRREGEHFLGVLDHAAHVTNAFGALNLALVRGKDLARARGPGLDGRADLAFTDAVAVTDVHGGAA